MSAPDTIYALSSGQPPAAIAVVRISGVKAGMVVEALAGKRPMARRASLMPLIDPTSGELLDNVLTLWFPGPDSATGEDLAEFHCHGGRAVVRAVETAIETRDGVRKAEAGEFTRRAFANGRMDLAEAEGLSDLLFAETELQRKAAVHAANGALSRRVEDWQNALLRLSAAVEAELDFSDEDDVHPANLVSITEKGRGLADSICMLLGRPRAEKLREGIRVVLAGPPNSGKSTLLNALVERDAAIVSDIAGTTRDVIEVPVAISGIPFLFIDTAGLRREGAEHIEQIGIDRAKQQFEAADIILWLGEEGEGPDRDGLIEIAPRSDEPGFQPKTESSLSISAVTGAGIDELQTSLVKRASDLLPRGDEISVNNRQAVHLTATADHLRHIADQDDFLIIAENIRLARAELDALTGRASTEDMLDALFGKFCIGK